MCISPVKVLNPSRRFIDGYHKVSLSVPCCKCDSCRDLQTRDWQVRAYAEFKHYQSIGGRTLFLTFTYKDSALPHHNYKEVQSDGSILKFHIPCFRHRDKVKFINSLRKHFERRYFVIGSDGKKHVVSDNKVKYLWCSEYATDERYTRRPHYHVLLHIPPCDYSDSQLLDLVRSFWSYEISPTHPFKVNGSESFIDPTTQKPYKDNRCHPITRLPLGWVKESTQGLVVKNMYACLYVAKYVCKDLSYFEHPDVSSFLDPTCSTYDERYKSIRFKLPKHFQSQGYGSSLFEHISVGKDEALLNGFHLPQYDKVLFRVPRYHSDKLFYNYLQDGRKNLTDYGRKYFINTFVDKVNNMVDNFKQFFDPQYITNHISDEQLSFYPLARSFEFSPTPSNIVDHLNSMLAGRSLSSLACYLKYYQGLSCYSQADIEEVSSHYSDTPSFVDYTKQLYSNSLEVDLQDYPLSEFVNGFTHEYDVPSTQLERSRRACKLTFSSCPCFVEFDKLIQCLTFLQSASTSLRLSIRKEKNRIYSNLQKLDKRNHYLSKYRPLL